MIIDVIDFMENVKPYDFEYFFSVLTTGFFFFFSLSTTEPKTNRRDILFTGSGPGSRAVWAADPPF